MGWAQATPASGASASTLRPMRRARGTSAGRCSPISWGVETVSQDRLSSSPSVSVPPSRRDGEALVADPLSVSRSLYQSAEVEAGRIGLERLYGLNSDPSSPESARTEMQRLWDSARAKGVSVGRRKIISRAATTSSTRRVRAIRREARPVVSRRQNTVLSVAEQFLRGLEHEVAEAECRGNGENARLRVLKHAEQIRLLGIVQRCSAHSVQYASPDPAPEDVARVVECLNTSPSIARTILDQARRARALLIRFSMRLCASLAQKYVRSGGVDFYTLLAEACAGLSEAIDRFDRSRDMKFSTYATHWVLRNVRRCLVDEARPVQLPPHIHYKLAKLLRIKSDVLANATGADQAVFETDPEALAEAIAHEAGMPVQVVRTTLVSGLPTLDLDKPVFDDSSPGENIDYLVHSNEGLSAGESPEQALEDEAREQLAVGTLNSLLSTLNSREANILRLRFGLNSERRELPRSEIAAAYGLTGERIRQIEEAALLKLSKPWRRKVLEQASQDLM